MYKIHVDVRGGVAENVKACSISHSLFPDIARSRHETRLIAIGTNPLGRKILLAFTLRERGVETSFIQRPV